ncbi:MAG TPA: SH3 domain-containing protein [Gammaproteobacteria bacterium]
MKRGLMLTGLLILVLGGVHAAATSNAQTVANVNLNDGPYSDAHTVAAVPPNTGVTILERRGGWYRVRLASGKDGWIPMTSLRFGSTNSAGSSWNASDFNLFESGRAGGSGTTATTGVRGLNTGDIANARPDPQAVNELDGWTATPNQARQFAKQLSLRAQKIPYLPDAGGK